MFETIEVPVWALWLGGLLALVAAVERLLLPSVRWYLKRRFNKAVNQLNDRLQLKIQPFKMTQRRVMIDRLAHDPKVIEAVLEHVKEENIPYDVAFEQAHRYAREIVPSFSAFTYFGFGIRIARWLSQAMYRVRLGYVNETALQEMDPDAAVVFVMNHRSNMDYVLVTYLAASRSALSYAVGEWARIWPLKQLIRSMGAYFIRRKSRNLLYRRVLSRYVQMATEAGVTQAVFPEGGLSRDGRVKPAKLGLLNYIMSGFDPKLNRDVIFIPVGMNYDRVLEDRVLIADGQGTKIRPIRKVISFFRFIFRQIRLRVTGKFYRYGYASVSFGTPVSLKEFMKGKSQIGHEKRTAMLGKHLMERISALIPILPVSLISTVLLNAQGASLSEAEIAERAAKLMDTLLKSGAYIHIPREDRDYMMEVGLRALRSRHAILEKEGHFSVIAGNESLLAYYANAIAHFDVLKATKSE